MGEAQAKFGASGNRKKRRRLLAQLGIALLLVAGLSAWCLNRRYLAVATRCLEVSQSPEKADIIIVLSGDDPPRLKKAADLYSKGYAPRILLTGFRDPHATLQAFCKDNGIPEAVVITEDKAVNTFENAALSRPYLRQRKARTVILVTSWYHSRRALQTFRHVVPEVRFVSVPTRESYWPLDRGSLTLETSKLFYYAIAHRVCPW